MISVTVAHATPTTGWPSGRIVGVQHASAAATLAVTTPREDFRELAAGHRVVPVTRKVLADSETPLSAYRKLAANRPGTFLLESAENGRSWSRWSFIGAGAPSALTVRASIRAGSQLSSPRASTTVSSKT